jgi:hypothetical protein
MLIAQSWCETPSRAHRYGALAAGAGRVFMRNPLN